MSAVPADVLPVVTVGEAACRVAHWWRVSRGGEFLGYASRSIIGKVMDEGCTGASHSRGVRPAPWMAPADELIDTLVARMPHDLRAAVVADQNRSEAMKQITAKLGCTAAEFHRRKEAGYGFIAGVLSVLERGIAPRGRG